MRTLVVNTFLTLDGVMQAPGGPEEDPSGGFPHGGWSVPFWDGAIEEAMGARMGRPFELLLGRRTYEIFAAHWPQAEGPAADVLNAATKHVASRTLDRVTWSNSRLLGDDVPAAVRELKAQDGPELQVHGSGDLVQTLLAEDLVDVLGLLVYPVTVGGGKRLFGDGTVPRRFALEEVASSGSGVVMATYRRAGALETGSFALEEPSSEERERRAGMDA